jgi:signal transduction histidine kinase
MRPRGSVLVGLALAGVAGLAGAIVVVLTSNHESHKTLMVFAGVFVGLNFMGTGLFAWWRRPGNHTGLLMYAVGAVFVLAGAKDANAPGLFAVGLITSNLFIAVLVHLLVAFPAGRLVGRAERWLVGAFYATVAVVTLAPLLFSRTCGCARPHPRNVLMVTNRPGLGNAIQAVAGTVLVALGAAIVVLLVRRWRAASPPQRRIVAPVLWTGAVLIAELALLGVLQLTSAPAIAQDAVSAVAAVTLAAVPLAFLAGLLRSRYTRGDIVGDLVDRLRSPAGDIRAEIAAALGDPTLELVYWRARRSEYVTSDGRPAQLPDRESGRAFAEIERDGEPIAALIFDPMLNEEPELVSAVSSAAALALDNERLQAALRARIGELEESRARVLDAELKERQRIERDLHDGAQQQFVSLSMTLALLDRGLTDAPPQRQLLSTAREQLDLGLAELRELARGIHPALLTERGLAPAIEALAARAPLDVRVLEVPEQRLPAQVETAAYFIVSESLTNAVKHAGAAAATVRIARDNGTAIVEVSDDGVGGADFAGGSGLRGLVDRLAALDGALDVDSPAGGGTHIEARIPCG